MTTDSHLIAIRDALGRIANALETVDHSPSPAGGLEEGIDAYHWDAGAAALVAVPRVSRVPLALLRGIERSRATLLANTEQFARGHGANNALLWGARGMGKSSLVKAVHADIAARRGEGFERLVLVEINREDIESLPALMRTISGAPARFIVFCDDLSFDGGDASYKSLKTILDGGLEGRPDNVLFYATSNRRHLMAREMIENELSTAISPGEAVDEKVSLSDRFGLWLGFHNCDQPTYLSMVRAYAERFGLDIPEDELNARAIEWAMTRGGRSGRVAIQFARALAGEMGRPAR